MFSPTDYKHRQTQLLHKYDTAAVKSLTLIDHVGEGWVLEGLGSLYQSE